MQILISPQELAAELGSADLVIVDCRFDLLQPGAGLEAWQAGHIKGAFYADLDNDLAAPVTADSGRHPLPDPETFAGLLGAWGILPSTRVVAYDDAGGAIAARLWWLLGWAGHTHAMLLDGGFSAWQAEGLPVDQSVPALQQGIYPISPGSLPIMTTDEVQIAGEAGQLTLIDARDSRRFAGEVEPIDTRAGHVPGAVNRPFQANLDAAGRFLPVPQLRDEFAALLNSAGQKNVACMCGSGVTACHHLFAMQLAGLKPQASLYVGSWSEWIRDPLRPCVPDDN